MNKPKALDLFCGAGGATRGLQMAGFEVTGIDIKPQPRYRGEIFIQKDAMDFRPRLAKCVYDFVWASPPCQRHSRMSSCRTGLRDSYPDYIADIRELLLISGLPFVIENVEGAPLVNPVTLCGAMFYLDTYRHRMFECHGFDVWWPPHPRHSTPTSKAGHWRPGTFVSVAGHCSPIQKCREAMGIDWMNREELAEAIPPEYSRFLGEQAFERIMDAAIPADGALAAAQEPTPEATPGMAGSGQEG